VVSRVAREEVLWLACSDDDHPPAFPHATLQKRPLVLRIEVALPELLGEWRGLTLRQNSWVQTVSEVLWHGWPRLQIPRGTPPLMTAVSACTTCQWGLRTWKRRIACATRGGTQATTSAVHSNTSIGTMLTPSPPCRTMQLWGAHDPVLRGIQRIVKSWISTQLDPTRRNAELLALNGGLYSC